ncbi:YraN family protein [Candidatus Kuenenbacteria bacterium]|nr:YraN family protein [Candidatus Kuenenbacteria bacterium]
MKGYKKKLGQWGEELALKFFEEKDHILIEKNWRANLQKNVGEIDLIFTKNKDLVFVEVKTRTTNAFGYGEQAVNYSKKQKISKTINHFRTSNEKYDDFFPRFDILVIEIFDLTPKYIHYENVEL